MKKIFILIIIVVIGFAFYSHNLIIHNKVLKNDDITLGDLQNNDIDLSIKDVELYCGSQKIDFDFNSVEKKYTIVLNDSLIDKIKVKAELNDNRAKFYKDYYGPRNVSLDYGENIVKLVVVGQNEEIKNIYTITIIRPKGLATDARLSFLKINGKTVKLTEELEYAVILDENNTKTEVETEVDTEGVRVEYKDIDLSYGDNELIISLVDDNNICLNYKIHVVRINGDSYKEFEKIVIKDVDFRKDKYEYNVYVDDNEYDASVEIYPANVLNRVTTVEHYDGKVKDYIVEILDDCETKKYTFHIIMKDEVSNTTIEKGYILYYFFFGISIIFFIASIVYSKKNKRR